MNTTPGAARGQLPNLDALEELYVLAAQHGEAIAHYQAGYDADARYNTKLVRLCAEAGVYDYEVADTLENIVEDRRYHDIGEDDTCALCIEHNADTTLTTAELNDELSV